MARTGVLLGALVVATAVCLLALLESRRRTHDPFEDHADAESESRDKAARAPNTEKTFSLSGQVVGCYGSPIARACAKLVPLRPSEEVPEVWTDAKGAFVFSGLPPGEYVIRITSSTWGLLEERERIENGSVRNVYTFAGRGKINGRIIGIQNGAGMSGFNRLSLLDVTAGNHVIVPRVPIDTDGGFLIDGVGVGSFLVQWKTLRYKVESSLSFESNGETKDCVLNVKDAHPIPKTAVYGRVLCAEEGLPIVGERIHWQALYPNGMKGGGSTITDDAGNYVIKVKAMSGGAAIRFICEGRNPVIREIRPEEAETDLELDLVFQFWTQGDTVLVVTESKQPVKYAEVAVFPGDGADRKTDSEGRFPLLGIKVSNSRFVIRHRNWLGFSGREWFQPASSALGEERGRGDNTEMVIKAEFGRVVSIVGRTALNDRVGFLGVFVRRICEDGRTEDWMTNLKESYRRESRAWESEGRTGEVFLAGLPKDGILEIVGLGRSVPMISGVGRIDLGGSEVLEPVELTLQPARPCRIRIVDEENQGVAGVVAQYAIPWVQAALWSDVNSGGARKAWQCLQSVGDGEYVLQVLAGVPGGVKLSSEKGSLLLGDVNLIEEGAELRLVRK